MPHQHIYDDAGKQICCTEEEKIYTKAGAADLLPKSATSKEKINKEKNNTTSAERVQGGNIAHSPEKHGHFGNDGPDHSDGHDHDHDKASNGFKMWAPASISLALLLLGIAFDFWLKPTWFIGWVRILWYGVAYLPVGLPVMKEAWQSIMRGQVFSEFLLMCIATVGAFAIGEYPEGVAVMLFYAVGEIFQTLAVSRAKNSIAALLDQRPDEVTVLKDETATIVKAAAVNIGDVLQLKPGEKLGLDAELLSERATFDTAALTGESQPDTKRKGEEVLAGMINLGTLSTVKVTKAYKDSKLSHILELVQNATKQKAPTELFIRKFAKIYTPIVVVLAVLIIFLPWLLVNDYVFRDWLYRALVFLVISCPCALVISIPLGYFGGIGAGSKNGILFKGSNFLDALANIKNVVMDKTGTMTEGVFKVQKFVLVDESRKDSLLAMVNKLESQSTHPVATAIHEYVGEIDSSINLSATEEIAGHGLKALAEGKELLVGNFKLLDKFNISYPIDPTSIVYTTIAIAYDRIYAGYLTIADSIKADAQETIDKLNKLGIETTMLSGDKANVVAKVAQQLGIKSFFGNLLPADKVDKVKAIQQAGSVAFVGDGVNDAPVVALSDVGIAMGGLGSDATVATADVVIQDDKPSKIPMAISIGKKTKQIVWQNISLAFGVKTIVLILGAGGLATMWEAVFADVGVALLAILNAVRIQRMKF